MLDRSASRTYNVNMRGLLAKKERFIILIRSFSTLLSHAPSWGAAASCPPALKPLSYPPLSLPFSFSQRVTTALFAKGIVCDRWVKLDI